MQSFMHGFLKGAAAPVMLYHFEVIQPTKPVAPIVPAQVSDIEALRSDWRKVGDDLRFAINSHAKSQG